MGQTHGTARPEGTVTTLRHAVTRGTQHTGRGSLGPDVHWVTVTIVLTVRGKSARTESSFAVWPHMVRADWVGNAHHGVALPYNYWTSQQWHDAFHRMGFVIEWWQSRLNLYPAGLNWIFSRSLHFATTLRPVEM